MEVSNKETVNISKTVVYGFGYMKHLKPTFAFLFFSYSIYIFVSMYYPNFFSLSVDGPNVGYIVFDIIGNFIKWIMLIYIIATLYSYLKNILDKKVNSLKISLGKVNGKILTILLSVAPIYLLNHFITMQLNSFSVLNPLFFHYMIDLIVSVTVSNMLKILALLLTIICLFEKDSVKKSYLFLFNLIQNHMLRFFLISLVICCYLPLVFFLVEYLSSSFTSYANHNWLTIASYLSQTTIVQFVSRFIYLFAITPAWLIIFSLYFHLKVTHLQSQA